MYSILFCITQVSNVILPNDSTADDREKSPNLKVFRSGELKSDNGHRNGSKQSNLNESKSNEIQESTGPLKIHFLVNVNNGMNQETPFQRSTELQVNHHFAHQNEFLSMRNCTATSYAFPLLNEANQSFRFNGITDPQTIIVQLCDEERCVAIVNVCIGSLFEDDDALLRSKEANDMIRLEKSFDVILHHEDDSTEVCRLRGQIHILTSPLLSRSSSRDSIFESVLPYLWIFHALLLLMLSRLFYETVLRGGRDRVAVSFSPRSIHNVSMYESNDQADLPEVVSAMVGPLQLRRGMSMLQGDVLAGCVGFHSSLCLPTLLTLDGKR